ncbi:hypothetical protein [Paenibacillus spongiae]|uniref:YfhE family protein n=1 Tax=Paenibacillus spongiae TaxID=2909671 RepID=A0ABY5S0A5_9BACL|nr:hypothetical protein [Paenibacillus spongiae]UVI27272.1 hypothetical protein L1F29_17470 [Paenibacillus spongiae]
MPNNKVDVETDGDPQTIYEDTTAHERTGFFLEDTEQLGRNASKKQADGRSDR